MKEKNGIPVIKKGKKNREEIKVPPRNLKLDINVASRDLPLRVMGNVIVATQMRIIDARKRSVITEVAFKEVMSIEDVNAEDRVIIVPLSLDGEIVSGYITIEGKRKVYKQ
ncbi:MAG: hypothetical protein PHU71_07145 [Candidatus Gracilibacteria bacterium]|nr:hypothetical protein [Candidatus Gracilibacteria bacterium]